MKTETNNLFLSFQIILMFAPLKEYFDRLSNCPHTIRKFFSRADALFWLHFVESQLKSSNEYVLKTEGKKIASFEVAAEVSTLRIKVENRKDALFIPHAAQQVFNVSNDSEKEFLNHYVRKFYTALSEYLEKWSKSLDGTEVFCWMELNSVPDWDLHVMPSLQYFSKHFNDDAIDVDTAFDETNILCQIVKEKLPEWKNQTVTSEKRWLEIFVLAAQQNRRINNLSMLVQYAFAIPGSSTEVERLFSIINDVWGPDKPQMKLETLEAYLNVKINSNLSCSMFYDSVKDNKQLLSQVHCSQKYRNDLQQTSSSTSELNEEQEEEDDEYENYYEDLFHESE